MQFHKRTTTVIVSKFLLPKLLKILLTSRYYEGNTLMLPMPHEVIMLQTFTNQAVGAHHYAVLL